MSTYAKFVKGYLEIAQISLGILGGVFYYLLFLLSFFVSPLRKLIAIYKEGAPIYSTLLMTLIATSILMPIPYLLLISRAGAPVGELTVSFLLLFLCISPWIFLSLDLFAYFKRFRRDRWQ
jgi:hypothetical protein